MYNIGKDPGTCYTLCPVRHNNTNYVWLKLHIGESLFSGGEDGQGEITVALHDAIFHPSDSRQHAASMLDYLRSKAIELAKANSEDEVEEITKK